MFLKVLKIRGRTHLGMCRQTPLTEQLKNINIPENHFLQKQKPEAAKTVTTCLQVPSRRHPRDTEPDLSSGGTALEIHFEIKTGKHAFQKTRAESAVEGCRPSWLSQERGVETLLRFRRTHSAKLALPDMGTHLQAFFHKLKTKQYEPIASWCA